MRIKHIIIRLVTRFQKGRIIKNRLSPDKLSPDVMATVMQEVEFLRNEHSVDVRSLEANEIPSIPKRVTE
jgi:hypothetical protein